MNRAPWRPRRCSAGLLLVPPSHARRTLQIGIVLAATLAPWAAVAAPTFGDRPCPPPTAEAKERCSGGFFARFGATAQVLHAKIEVVEVMGTERYVETSHPTALMYGGEGTLGGAVAPEFLLGGFVSYATAKSFSYRAEDWSSAEPDYTWHHRGNGTKMERIRFGVALALYPDPARGLVIDIRPNIGGLESMKPLSPRYATYGLELGLGYELWMTQNHGLGLSLRVEGARGRSALAVARGPSHESGWLVSSGLALTWTLH